MQSLSRALSSLRGVCSSSGRFTAARTFSEAAAEGTLGDAAGVPTEGAKTVLHRLLTAADRPLTSAEVWSLAGEEGLKSKRFAKQMLQQMRQRGHVKTVPMGGGKKKKSFGYLIPGSAAEEAHVAARTATPS